LNLIADHGMLPSSEVSSTIQSDEHSWMLTSQCSPTYELDDNSRHQTVNQTPKQSLGTLAHHLAKDAVSVLHPCEGASHQLGQTQRKRSVIKLSPVILDCVEQLLSQAACQRDFDVWALHHATHVSTTGSGMVGLCSSISIQNAFVVSGVSMQEATVQLKLCLVGLLVPAWHVLPLLLFP
jgi:hypothetical protein